MTLWKDQSEKFDTTEYQLRGEEQNRFLGRAVSMQRLFFDAQNIIANAKDQTKKDLEMVTECFAEIIRRMGGHAPRDQVGRQPGQ
jgi:hypothetical protein